jgi:hypothetical protein
MDVTIVAAKDRQWKMVEGASAAYTDGTYMLYERNAVQVVRVLDGPRFPVTSRTVYDEHGFYSLFEAFRWIDRRDLNIAESEAAAAALEASEKANGVSPLAVAW